MTETFLDRQQVHDLIADLRLIASGYPELVRIARRETSPPGGRASRNPNGYSSRPPVNLSALSSAQELSSVLSGWVACLRDDAGIELPKDIETATLAVHLQRHVHQVAQQVWAEDCADEMKSWAGVVDRNTSELRGWSGRRIGMQPRDLDEAASEVFLSESEVIELHFHVTGVRLSGATLRSWRRSGALPDRRRSGAPMYWYEEVKKAVRNAPAPEGRHAKSKKV